MACRTPELGGHLYQCSNCSTEQFVPHSCRNRHCPTCQGANGYAWMQQQADSLLPIPYFHVVFTLPHVLNPLIQQNQQACYDLLFASASAALLEFGRNELQAQLGITLVLHTWSQSLGAHFHVHAIVTGGGLRDDGTWAETAPHWLFPVLALSPMFRGKFRAGLKQLYQDCKLEFHGEQAAIAVPDAFATFLPANAVTHPARTLRQNPSLRPPRPTGIVAPASRRRERRCRSHHQRRLHFPAGAADATPTPDLPPGLPARCPHCHQPTPWILLRRVARPPARPLCTVPVLDSS